MLIEKSVDEYLSLLASEAPAPGGGAASALAGAQGAALVMMVANLTIGKKKYEEYEVLNLEAREACGVILSELAACADADAEAYEKVASAFALPKGTDEEKAARREEIAEASVGAALVPLACMRSGLGALILANTLLGRSNKNLVSDLYVAALNLKACVAGAKYNVDANLPQIKDKELAADIAAEAEQILAEAVTLADGILNRVD